MAAASPIDPRIDPVLASAVRKLRAEESLTVDERAAVRRRGREILEEEGLEAPEPGMMLAVDEDEDTALEEDAVLGEADEREGFQGLPWRDAFARLGIPVPPE